MEELLEKLYKLSLRDHYFCEDCWYTCPKHEDGCCNDAEGNECNCGADKINKEASYLYKKLKDKLCKPT